MKIIKEMVFGFSTGFTFLRMGIRLIRETIELPIFTLCEYLYFMYLLHIRIKTIGCYSGCGKTLGIKKEVVWCEKSILRPLRLSTYTIKCKKCGLGSDPDHSLYYAISCWKHKKHLDKGYDIFAVTIEDDLVIKTPIDFS